MKGPGSSKHSLLAIITFWSQAVIKSAITTSGLPAIKTTMDRHFVRQARKKGRPVKWTEKRFDERNCQSERKNQRRRRKGTTEKRSSEESSERGIRSSAAVIIWHNYWLSFSVGAAEKAFKQKFRLEGRLLLSVPTLRRVSRDLEREPLARKVFYGGGRLRMQSGFPSVES